MAKFLITYDNRPPCNYDALYRLMAAWSAVRIADSVWLASLNADASQVRGFVVNALQRNDIVAVLELQPGSDWATSCVNAAANAWLSAHIRPAQIAA
jgi:hypothetical protein